MAALLSPQPPATDVLVSTDSGEFLTRYLQCGVVDSGGPELVRSVRVHGIVVQDLAGQKDRATIL